MDKNPILEIKSNFDLMKKTVSKLWKCFKEHIGKILLIVFIVGLLLVALAVAVEVPKNIVICLQELLGLSEKDEMLKFIGFCIAGVVSIWLALSADKRANAMDATAKNTEEGQRQERLKNAIEHLGHKRDSVRMGGAYELFHLAKDTEDEDLRQTVLDILCAHIRQTTTGQTTRGKDYQTEYKTKPSEEIQSLLTLLFVQEHNIFEGCSINLQGSYLNGANLFQARLKRANLGQAQLQRAILWEAQLQEANLREAQLQEANLKGAQLQRAVLIEAQLEGAVLRGAQLQRAELWGARMQGANLWSARLQGAFLGEAKLQKAELMAAQLQGANLGLAQMQGADLNYAKLQGADLNYAKLQGANLSEVQLQGANLIGAKMQGTNLSKAQLQGADLSKAQLQGVSSQEAYPPWFENRIRNRIGRSSDLTGIIFSGGLQEEDLDALCGALSSGQAQALRKKLRPHVGKSASNELPADSGAETDPPYTQEEAEQWIAEYQEAMREVPKRDDS